MTHLPRIAGRLFNTPLLVLPETALTVAANLSDRLGVDMDGVELPVGARRDSLRPGAFALGLSRPDDDEDDAPYGIHDGTATIPIHGELVNRGSWLDAYSGLVSYDGLTAALRQAEADPAVTGILLDIDSPGGEASGCMEAADVVRDVAGTKPVSAFVNGLGCSAAYALAAGCTDITVTPSALVGSIGVVLMHVDRTAALGKAGLKPTLIHAGAYKVDGHSAQPLADGARDRLQARIDGAYDLFVGSVASHRPMTDAAVRGTEAGVFMGAEAVKIGLADRVGTLADALATLPKPAPATAGLPAPFRGSTMTTPTETISRAAHDAAVASLRAELEGGTAAAVATARAEGVKAGATDERTRIAGILGHAEAKERATQARHLAFSTGMAVDAAADLLVASAKEVAATATTTTKTHRLDAIVPVPPVGADAGEVAPQSEGERGASAFAAARGVKPAAAR